jgi:hypothetical protein
MNAFINNIQLFFINLNINRNFGYDFKLLGKISVGYNLWYFISGLAVTFKVAGVAFR